MFISIVLSVSVGLFWGASLQAKPDFSQLTESLRFPNALKIELQGGVAKYDEEKLESIYEMLRSALKTVRDLAPAGDPFFSQDPRGRNYSDRSFSLVLTDTNVVQLGDGNSVKANPSFDAMTVVTLISPDGVPTRENLVALLRLDRLVFDSNGGHRTYGYFKILNSLIQQLCAFWTEHLKIPVSELTRVIGRDPAAFEVKVTRRAADLFHSLLTHPIVLADEHAGDFLGQLFGAWVERLEYTSALTLQNEGPATIPMLHIWGQDTLSSLTPYLKETSHATLYRAWHLIYSVRPPEFKQTLFHLDGKPPTAMGNKSLQFFVLDSRDKVGRSMVDGPLQVGLFPWLPSETIVATEERGGGHRSFTTVLWADRIFYTADGRRRSDDLAEATVAMACEFYEAVQSFLLTPNDQAIASSKVEIDRLRIRVLKRGVSYVDLLKKHSLWATLSSDEKESFLQVQARYLKEVKLHECGLELLAQAGEK